MSYLSSLIGQMIYIDISNSAREDKMLKLFFETNKHEDLLMVKLLGVDGLGIWVRAFKNVTVLRDENNDPIPVEKQESVEREVDVFVNFAYISGIACIAGSDNSRIGF